MTQAKKDVTDDADTQLSFTAALAAHPVLGRFVVYMAVAIFILLALIVYKVIDLATSSDIAAQTNTTGQPAAVQGGAASSPVLAQIPPGLLSEVRPRSGRLVSADYAPGVLTLAFSMADGSNRIILVDLTTGAHTELVLP